MKVLAIDTSGLVAAAAVTENGRLLAEFRTDFKKTHSQMLMPMVEALQRSIDLDLSTLDLLAVAEGPGSFTGLRIGAATIKGLGLALHLPIMPVPTVDALAWQLLGEPGIICPMMDARRDQVYTGLYRFHGRTAGEQPEARMMSVIRPQCAVSAKEIIAQINEIGEPVTFLGDGFPVHETLIRESIRVPWCAAPAWKCRQSAAALADLAVRYLEAGKASVPAESFVPVYLRPSQAERERNGAAGENARAKAVIRRMVPGDAAAAAVREKLCLAHEAWSEVQLAEAADRRDCYYVTAEVDGRTVGHAGMKAVCGEGAITNVCVDPDFRRQGIAKQLVETLLSERQAMHIGDCTLEVRAGNAPAISLYERLGFVSEGVRPGFYEQPAEDAVIYWLRS